MHLLSKGYLLVWKPYFSWGRPLRPPPADCSVAYGAGIYQCVPSTIFVCASVGKKKHPRLHWAWHTRPLFYETRVQHCWKAYIAGCRSNTTRWTRQEHSWAGFFQHLQKRIGPQRHPHALWYASMAMCLHGRNRPCLVRHHIPSSTCRP